MNSIIRLIPAALLAVFITTSLQGNEITWTGIGTKQVDDYGRIHWFEQIEGVWGWQPGVDASDLIPYSKAGDTAVNGLLLWDSGTVPGPGDTARFHMHDNVETFVQIDKDRPTELVEIVIDGDFNPDHIIINSYDYRSPKNDVNLDKDLELETLYVYSGYSSNRKSLFRVLEGRTLTVTGEVPLTFIHNGLNYLVLATATSTLRLHAPEQSFVLDDGRLNTLGGNRLGGVGIIEFTYPEAEITLVGPGNRTQTGSAGLSNSNPGVLAFPSLALGPHVFRVRSDQAWLNPSGTGSIHILGPRNNEPFIEAIDGQRLDNFDQVPFYFFLGSNLTRPRNKS